jgi:preprotein translocase subunit SecE|tara:strand:- start:48 stop:293 length:246 start_codon:yes stop_codon:yes gene_type:complete
VAKNAVKSAIRNSPTKSRGPRFGVFSFFGEVFGEMKKVTWPSREETTRLTILVLAVSIAIGAMLGVLDLLFTTVSDEVLFT